MQKALIGFGIVALAAACSKPQPSMTEDNFPAAPIAPKNPTTFNNHGYSRVDDYFWLKDKKDPKVLAYIKAENAYADTVMASTKALQETLYKEMRGRIKEQDQSVPVPERGYFYYSRTEEGQQYSISCRKKGSLDAAEEVLINGNEMVKGHDAFIYAGGEVSPNNEIFGFQSNFTGSYAEFTLQFKDLKTGKLMAESVPLCSSFAFANDSRTVYYSIPNAALRSYKIFKLELGSGKKAELVAEEKDEQFSLYVGRSKDDKYITSYSGSFTTSEIGLIDADKPSGKFKIFAPRTKDVDYSVESINGSFLVLYKDPKAKNKKVYAVGGADIANRAAWREIVPHSPTELIEGLDTFNGKLVINIRKDGLKQIKLMDLATKKISPIAFPEPVYNMSYQGNPEFNGSTLRYVYQSLNRPRTTYEYDFATAKSKVLKQQEIPSGFDPDKYEVKRLFATAKDGTKVPMAITYKKGTKIDGTAPALLYSYGSYGSNTEPNFDANAFSLIDRGFVYGIAQIRGGSEMGEEWYENGKMMHKMNTFTDFIACSEELIKQKYTSSDRLAINGGSAGGLLMGAVTNLRPDLYKVVVAEVPFVDVINTMLDSSLPLTTQEWEQWGNPNIKAEYDYMMTYSPYDNIKKTAYPHILATGGLNDSQVLFHEPTKWVAKLRAHKTDKNLTLLRINMESGHGGATGRFDYLKEEAFRTAFILDRIGAK